MLPTADDVIVARARRDAEEGVQHALEVLREGHGRAMAAALTSVVRTAVETLHVLDRLEPEVRFLLERAHRLNAGEDARALAREALPELLRRKRVHLLVRDKDPAYHALEATLLGALEARLPDLARMAAVPDPADYDDLVRRAFPDRARVDHVLAEQAALAHGVIAHFEEHPHLLRVPRGLVPKLAESAREMVRWQFDKVRRGVDEIYAAPGTQGGPWDGTMAGASGAGPGSPEA